MGIQPSRRMFLAGASLMAAVQAPASSALARPVSPQAGLPDLSQPQEVLRQMIRMQASLDEVDVPWHFDGVIYGVVGDGPPTPLFGYEGVETYWMRKLPDDTYELTGNTVTYIRDFQGAWLESFANPYTGATNTPEPGVQGGRAGRGFNYSATAGVRMTPFMDRIPPSALKVNWSFLRDQVVMRSETQYPPGMKPPRLQHQAAFANLRDFSNPELRSLPTTFSSVVMMPWFRWMNMGDLPGHMLWHASGAKLTKTEDLPAPFLTRVQREFPDRLTANPFADAPAATAVSH